MIKVGRGKRLISILKRFGGTATLGRILNAIRNDGGLVYKFTAAVSEARDILFDEGKTIKMFRGKSPSKNLYKIVERTGQYA